MERKLRRYQSNLVVAGEGTMIFGLWGVIKTILMFIFFYREYYDVIHESFASTKLPEYATYIALGIMYFVVFSIIAIDLLLRFYIGIAAVREGMGSPQKMKYVVVAGLTCAFYLTGNIFQLYGLKDIVHSNHRLDEAASMILDITSTITAVSLFVNAVRVKMIVKRWI